MSAPARPRRLSLQTLEAREVPAVYVVTDLADGPTLPNAGTGTSSDPFRGSTLRGAIDDINANHAAEDNTIRLRGGATYTLTQGQLTVDLEDAGSLLIRASRQATIERGDDTGDYRIFEFSNDTEAELRRIRVTNGLADGGDGGGILNFGNLTLRRSEVSGNLAVSDFGAAGGGIANFGTLALVATEVSDNSVDGGLGDGRGGGIAQLGFGGSLSLTGSLVAGNVVTSKFSAFGGGISDDGGSTITLHDSTLADNQALGGAGFFFGDFGGDAAGGGFYSRNGEVGSSIRITRSTFADNSAVGGSVSTGGEGALPPGENAPPGDRVGGDAYGGGLAFDDAQSVLMVNCTISGNRTQAGEDLDGDDHGVAVGGGIYHSGFGETPTQLVNLTITQNTALGVDAIGQGGGVYNEGNDGVGTPVRVWNTIIARNFVDLDGDELDGANVFGDFVSDPEQTSGHNLIGSIQGSSGFGTPGSGDIIGPAPVDPLLNPLAFYGGPTRTHLPRRASRAIDAGDDAVLAFLAAEEIARTDQRGVRRKIGQHVDIGAVELGNSSSTNRSINRRWDR